MRKLLRIFGLVAVLALPGYSQDEETIQKLFQEAIQTMYRALSEYVIEGVKTTIPFHLQLMQDERFRSGDFNTKFLEGFKLV